MKEHNTSYMIVSGPIFGGIAHKIFLDRVEAQLWVMMYGPDKFRIVPLMC